MTLQQEKILSLLTGAIDSTGTQVDTLQEITDRYPYFPPAQLLLAIRMRAQHDAGAAAQSSRTSLYVPNTAWLQYQLTGGHEIVDLSKEKSGTTIPETVPTVEDFTAFMHSIQPMEPTHEEKEADDTDNTEATEDLPEEGHAKIAEMLSNQLADFKKPVDDNTQLEIDKEKIRLYTIDYFASQGIRFDMAAHDDKLSHQLRKFTDWLKYMKPETAAADMEMSEELENAVIQIAQKSNQSREIVTETMAEVFAKQGQIEKAIRLYGKLSFINPEKSAYFAAKIQQLKGI